MIAKEAIIHPKSSIGKNTLIEEFTIVNSNAVIGDNCRIHRHVFIDTGVTIGNNVKIQDNVMIPEGVVLCDGVFVGPSVAFTNDLYPRAINSDGTPKNRNDWKLSKTTIEYGASLGANSTIVCGVTIGKWAMVGAGTVVTQDVPPYALVVGNPARIIKFFDSIQND